MRLLLVDDHGLFRDGVGLWLRRLQRGTEVSAADDLEGALRRLQDDRLPFDLIISDLVMPGMDGVAGLARLCKAATPVPVLVLSARHHPLTVAACLDAGACGYLSKQADGQAMLAAIGRVLAGERVLPEGALPEQGLSPRQLALLRCLAEGMSNKDIAATLHLSEGTVKQYLNELYLRLGVHNRSQAALEAREILALPGY